MQKIWFLAQENEPLGPLDLEQLQARLRQNLDWKNCLIWREGFSTWMRASEVDEVKSSEIRPPPIPASSSPTKEPKSKTSFLVTFLSWIFILLAAVVGGLIGKKVVGNLMNGSWSSPLTNEQKIEKGFAEAVVKIKGTLPQKLDQSTTLIDVMHSGVVLTYYNILDVKKADFPKSYDFTAELMKIVKKSMCENFTMKNTMSLGAVYRYSYKDNLGEKLAEISFDKNSCS